MAYAAGWQSVGNREPCDEATRIETPKPNSAGGGGAWIGHRRAVHACLNVRAGKPDRSVGCRPEHESGFRFRFPTRTRPYGRRLCGFSPSGDQRGTSEHARSGPDAPGICAAGAGHVAAVAVRRTLSCCAGPPSDFPARAVERTGTAQTRVRVADLIVLPFLKRNLAASVCCVLSSCSTAVSVAPSNVFPPAGSCVRVVAGG